MKLGIGPLSYVEITPDDAVWLLKLLFKNKTTELDYSPEKAFLAYSKNLEPRISINTIDGIYYAPYQIVYDYRDKNLDKEWGVVDFEGRFKLKPELLAHRNDVIRLFKKNGKLGKGNLLYSRLKKFKIDEKGIPNFFMELSEYHDYIATNLTMDFDFRIPLGEKDNQSNNIRAWDISQAGLKYGQMPSFENTILANHFGVAVGICARSEKDDKVYIPMRFRSSKVAVYANMWHLPLSFGHSPGSFDEKPLKQKLWDYIKADFCTELQQEIGIEIVHFDNIKPLAFCRDLIRGGAPQLFMEMWYNRSLEDLIKETKGVSDEFKKSARVVDFNKDKKYSSELVAYLMLKASNNGI